MRAVRAVRPKDGQPKDGQPKDGQPEAGQPGQEGSAIRTEDLRKTYKSPRGDVQAVRGVDLDVHDGEFFGLLGPNGAGKSTTIGMLTTLVLPTAGRAWVAGIDVVADPVGVKRRIGVVSQHNTADVDLTVAENLEFRGRYFGLGLRDAARRAEPVARGVRPGRPAQGHGHRPVRRAGAAAAHRSGPGAAGRTCCSSTSRPCGLDPQGTRVNLWDASCRCCTPPRQTIMLTTHYLEEAEARAV